MATKYEQHVSTFKSYVEKPGGTAWEGQTAEAGQANAGDGWKVAARIQDLDTKFQTTAGMAVDHTIVPELINCQHMIHNAESQRDKGVTLTEDLVMGYNPPPGISEKLAEENAQLVKVRGEELKESARKWYEAEQEVKRLAEGVMRDIENEVNGAAGTFDIGKAVKDNAPRKPEGQQDANFYKQWYPKKTDPASADPGVGTLADSVDRIKNPPTSPAAATALVDPNAPQYGPFAKDTIDKTKVGGLGESVTYLNRNDKPPEEHKPSAAERFKTNISEGIDKGVDKLVAPFTDLRDRLGLGDKGFWEANEEAGKREWESFKHQMTTPPIVDTAEGIKHNIENPGQYVGERLVDGGALMAGGPEGLLPRAGLEEAAVARLGAHPDLPAPGALHDTPAPAHTELPSGPTHHDPVVEHPAPSGDHTPSIDHDSPSHVEIGPIEHPLTDGGGSTYKERIDQTPINNGHWTGERGESQWISQNPDVNHYLHESGVDGIHYSNGQPDFGPVAKGQVDIPDMSTNRNANFRAADEALGHEWGMTRKEVERWRIQNDYSWHEEPNLKTMQLVPTIVNGRLGHVGGIGELNRGAVPPVGGDGP
ncbi:HNH endonuclease [Mycobacteroides chelonae]|uniref:HNH endonuclease n=1 Tax=Mycobacteroides chelonae TaxID=1774 RepID=UPI000F83FC94|nr:HNH endonuclease [Mycobacteroides chelonae]